MASYLYQGECHTEAEVLSFPPPAVTTTLDGLFIFFESKPEIRVDGGEAWLFLPFSVYDGYASSSYLGTSENWVYLEPCDLDTPLDENVQLIIDLLCVGLVFFAFAAGFMKGGQR